MPVGMAKTGGISGEQLSRVADAHRESARGVARLARGASPLVGAEAPARLLVTAVSADRQQRDDPPDNKPQPVQG